MNFKNARTWPAAALPTGAAARSKVVPPTPAPLLAQRSG
jgi:hypothetical protein